MAQAMASMAGLRGSSQAVLEGSLQLRGSSRLSGAGAIKVVLANPRFGVKANLQPETEITSRRAALGLVAAGIASGSFVQAVLAKNAKQSGELAQAADHAKESAKDMENKIESFIDKENWKDLKTFLQENASHLYSDLDNVITAMSSSKDKQKRKSLKDLTRKLFTTINNLEKAATIPSVPQAKKYYAETVSALKDFLSKIA